MTAKKKTATRKPAKKKASKKKAARKKVAKKAPRKANSKPEFKPKEDWYTQTEAARFCRVSVTMFQRYGLDPVARNGRCTYYSHDQLIELIERRGYRKGHEAGLREGTARVPTDAKELMLEKEQAELDWTREKAEGQRLRNAELRRELAPVGLLTWSLGNLGGQIRSILQPLPGKLKRRCPKLTNTDVQAVRSEIAKCLNIVAEVRLNWDEYSAESGRKPDSD